LIHSKFASYANEQQRLSAFGSSEFAKVIIKSLWGTVPFIDLGDETALHKALARLAEAKLIHSACDISDGGLAVALAEAGFANGIGSKVASSMPDEEDILDAFFTEASSSVIVTCNNNDRQAIQKLIDEYGELYWAPIGTTTSGKFELVFEGHPVIDTTISDLKQCWSQSLESTLHDQTANEVLA
ncbi:MAG: AIR synthase-related protein, partial [Silvibacterium sp.]